MIKNKLTTTLIMVALDWDQSSEIMCDASDYALRVVLGQHHDKIFQEIYYSSQTLDNAQQNYTMSEKEMLTVIFALDLTSLGSR